MVKSNLLLKAFTQAVYRERAVSPPENRVNYRLERVNGGLLCDLWFLTTGCLHDMGGGCVMCNYGKGSPWISKSDEDAILAELKQIVGKLSFTFEDFLLTSSGSILDIREVSLRMRENLIPILESVRAKRLIIETRAETVTDENLDFWKRIPSNGEKYVEIGLESSSDWVLQHCLNKESSFSDFQRAVETAHSHGILVTANIGLGIPFLSERATISSAVQSIRDALAAQADSIVVLPYHVKRGTLLDILYQEGLYQCVSLWALAEVLSQFPEEKIQISWYKDYFDPEHSFIRSSPDTCRQCSGTVIKLLDQYRNTTDPALIKRLREYPCTCHKHWRQSLEKQPVEADLDWMESAYRRLANIIPVKPELLEQELARMKQEYKELWVK